MLFAAVHESGIGTSVWTGRALQAESDDLEIWRSQVLHFCIRPLNGTFVSLAIMDIRARSISFASRPRRPYVPPDHERAGETFSPSPHFDSQTLAGKPTLAPGISLSRLVSLSMSNDRRSLRNGRIATQPAHAMIGPRSWAFMLSMGVSWY